MLLTSLPVSLLPPLYGASLLPSPTHQLAFQSLLSRIPPTPKIIPLPSMQLDFFSLVFFFCLFVWKVNLVVEWGSQISSLPQKQEILFATILTMFAFELLSNSFGQVFCTGEAHL